MSKELTDIGNAHEWYRCYCSFMDRYLEVVEMPMLVMTHNYGDNIKHTQFNFYKEEEFLKHINELRNLWLEEHDGDVVEWDEGELKDE